MSKFANFIINFMFVIFKVLKILKILLFFKIQNQSNCKLMRNMIACVAAKICALL